MSHGDVRKPIFSTLADDLEYRESIDEFVIGLAERIDALQDAERAGDRTELADLARFLACDASKLGFELLSNGATEAEEAARESDAGELHERLVRLTGLSQRIRRGHRGAL